jgi:hypothetical protein
MTTPSRTGLIMPIISALGSMPGSSTNGSLGSDSVRRTTAPIHSAGRKRLSSTSRRETYAPYRFCLAIRRSRARSATSASISRMRSPSLRARRCSSSSTSASGSFLLLFISKTAPMVVGQSGRVGSPNRTYSLKDAYTPLAGLRSLQTPTARLLLDGPFFKLAPPRSSW